MKRLYVILITLLLVLVGCLVFYKYVYLSSTSCIQVLVSATSRITGEEKVFSNPCSVPFWYKDVNNYNPQESDSTNAGLHPSLEFSNNALEEKGDEIQITERSPEKSLDSDGPSQEYRIISLKAGDAFYEDDPITVEWEGPDNFQSLSFYLLPSNCSDDECEEEFQTQFPLRTLLGFAKESAGAFTLSLRDNSPNVAYPEGEYRIALRSSHEGPQPILTVSQPFTILPPRDKSRDIWIGDKLGDFTITGLNKFNTINTAGTTTVRGFVSIDDTYGRHCFDVVQDDYKKLPYSDFDDWQGWFCFNNDIPKELLGTEGTTTIQISNYQVNREPKSGSVDSAYFVQVIR